jgi:hypothetical protein
LRCGSVISTSSSIGECKDIVYVIAEGLLSCKVETTADPSVAEAGAIVATVGALSLSLIVPVAEGSRQ